MASDVTVAPPYDRALREFYHAKLEHLEFRNADKSYTMGIINDFIDEATGIHPMLEQPPEAGWRLFIVDAMSLHSRHSGPKFPKNSTFQNAQILIFANFKAWK